MPISSSTVSTRLKPLLWAALGCMTLSVIFYSEVPLLRSHPEQAYISRNAWLIFPHIFAGTIALLAGPIQFSSRLRRRNPAFHRFLGRCYICAVFVAAPLAVAIAIRNHIRQDIYFTTANIVQAGTWIITSAAAFLTARNGHIQQHREWMVRSYAVTFTFVLTRVLRPVPAWNHLGRVGSATAIILITFAAILVPDVALHWRQLTSRRVST